MSTHFLLHLLITTLLVASTQQVHGDEDLESKMFTVPIPMFMGALQPAMGIINQIMSNIPSIPVAQDPRSSYALEDCAELLAKATEQVDSTMRAAQSPSESKKNGSGDLQSDMRIWLSAASTNQDTCMQGCEGANPNVVSSIMGTINQLNAIMQQTLSMISQTPAFGGSQPARGLTESDFPYWLPAHDRKLLQETPLMADIVVAQDGTGNYFTIMDAVNATFDYADTRVVIYVKSGIYDEHVEIPSEKWNIMLVGDGVDQTIITGSRSVVDGFTTYSSATVAVNGRGFFARDITFENTAGPEKLQAVAFRGDSDLSVLYRCRFQGYQDTLYAHTLRQFYKECEIHGTVDFIFGNAAAVFQNCDIQIKRNTPGKSNVVTAQGRIDPNQPTGFALQFCNISAEADMMPELNATMGYLGRPWKNFSRTVVMQSYLSEAIYPAGWLEWRDTLNLDTLFYGEYENFGPGSGVSERVTWPGYSVITSSFDAYNFTVSQLIDGDYWLPTTGVSYSSGLEA